MVIILYVHIRKCVHRSRFTHSLQGLARCNDCHAEGCKQKLILLRIREAQEGIIPRRLFLSSYSRKEDVRLCIVLLEVLGNDSK